MIAIGRVHFVMFMFVLLALGMASRVVFLHVVDRDFLQDQGEA